MVAVKCPYCRTIFQAGTNVGTHCPNCHARISVGNGGVIKSSMPPKH